MRRVLALLLLLPLIAASAAGWQVGHDAAGGGVRITNPNGLRSADLYLLHADLDLPLRQWHSWGLYGGWRRGLGPITTTSDLPPFDVAGIGDPPEECTAGRRCFLAMIAVSGGDSPLDPGNWLRVSVHPLTAAAARMRLPGQRLFLDADTALLPRPEPATDVTTTAGEGSTTEKPDLVRLEGLRLLYANGAAERFQVIDLADPAVPRLEAEYALEGTPREIYALNGHYVLMQGRQWDLPSEGTRITTLRLTDQGRLEAVAEYPLEGDFVESRRREGVIYAVTQRYRASDGATTVTVDALEVTPAGGVESRAQGTFNGYAPEVAIFDDHLVVTGHDTDRWGATNIQLYDLARADTPLHPLPPLQVPGRVPSEFHLDVSDGLLRLVYGPPDGSGGSTLALYALDDLALTRVGAAGPIAPGEQLFATRFVGDTAYVVTYERTDPLWVIDLTVPTAPVIVGELEVPGWSELLFFNDQRLFAVGIDDQPTTGEEWAQRVALSLFDVADPTAPRLLSRLTPLTGEARYSHSPALDDERALLLDWNNGFAALPITHWDTTVENRLQLVTIDRDSLTDTGYLESATAIRRTVELDIDTLVALGDQTLTTLRRGDGAPQRLGELELARNLGWIAADDDGVWVAGAADGGYHRLYRYPLDQLETPADQQTLATPFQQAIADDGALLFYNLNPLTVQYVAGGQAGPPLDLEDASDDPGYGWQRSVLLAGGRVYLGETRASIRERPFYDLLPPAPEEGALSTLRSWRVADGVAEEETVRSVPGRAVAVNDDGELLTLEQDADGSRLHHLVLEGDSARLLASHTLPCGWPSTLWRPPALYVACAGDYATDGGSTTLIRFNADGGFAEEGRWRIEGGGSHLIAADATRVVINQYAYTTLPEPLPPPSAVADTSIFVPTTSRCRILDLSGTDPVEVATPEGCGGYSAAITGNRLLQARGFAGLRETRW